MKVNEGVYENNRRLWLFMAFILVLEVALILLFCYKNIYLTFLILITPPLLISIVKSPKIGLWLMTVTYFTSFGMWGFPKALTIATAITLIAFLTRIFTKDEKLLGSKQLVYLIIFGAVALLSYYPARDLIMWGKGIYEILRVFIFFILIVNLIKTEKDIWTLIYIIVFSITAGAIYGLYSFKAAGFLKYLVLTGNLVRSGSIVIDANVWAVSLIASFPLTIALIKKEKNKNIKLFLYAVILILTTSIFATFSRGGMFAFSIVVIIIIFKTVKKKFISIIIILLLILIAYFMLPPFVTLRIKTLLSLFQKKATLDPSILLRTYTLKGSFKMFLKHPLLGVGLRNVVANSGLYLPYGKRLVAHCMYLEIAAGTGLLGLISFLAIFYHSFRDFFDSYKFFDSKEENSLTDLSFFAGLSLFGVCVTALFLSIQFNLCIWFLIAISVVVKTLAINYQLKNR